MFQFIISNISNEVLESKVLQEILKKKWFKKDTWQLIFSRGL